MLKKEIKLEKEKLEEQQYNIALKRTIKNKFKKITNKIYKRKIHNLISTLKPRKIIVHIAVMGYDAVMKQRPHQIAREFSMIDDVLYFYVFYEPGNKNIEKISERLYLVKQYNELFEILDDFYIHIYANSKYPRMYELREQEEKGIPIIYEYIDALHDDLEEIDAELLEKHKYIISKKHIPIFCTASELYEEVRKKRKENVYLTSNGVNYEDFVITEDKDFELPTKLKNIYSKKKNIICYYGAISKWLDYKLLEKLAINNKNNEIILIGKKYGDIDNKLNKILKYKNVHYLGAVDYNELIQYGYYSTVLMIPFLINEVTNSTSPVKLFEYMAMEKPVVTTNMPECRKYDSIFVSKDHNEFIKNIDKAIKMKEDPKLKEALRIEALENTWKQKTKDIYSVIDNNDRRKK